MSGKTQTQSRETVAPPPGKWDLNLRNSSENEKDDQDAPGVVVLESLPSCQFQDNVSVGDRTVQINDRQVKVVADLSGVVRESEGSVLEIIRKNATSSSTTSTPPRISQPQEKTTAAVIIAAPLAPCPTHTIVAPPGKLGLRLDNDHICQEVMDYSPMIGKVLPYDRIICVNDVDVTSMSTLELVVILNQEEKTGRLLGIQRTPIIPPKPPPINTTGSSPVSQQDTKKSDSETESENEKEGENKRSRQEKEDAGTTTPESTKRQRTEISSSSSSALSNETRRAKPSATPPSETKKVKSQTPAKTKSAHQKTSSTTTKTAAAPKQKADATAKTKAATPTAAAKRKATAASKTGEATTPKAAKNTSTVSPQRRSRRVAAEKAKPKLTPPPLPPPLPPMPSPPPPPPEPEPLPYDLADLPAPLKVLKKPKWPFTGGSYIKPRERLGVKKTIILAHDIDQSIKKLESFLAQAEDCPMAHTSLKALIQSQKRRCDAIFLFDEENLSFFERGLRLLVKFKMEHGHTDVTDTCNQRNLPLERFVTNWRGRYWDLKRTLEEEKEAGPVFKTENQIERREVQEEDIEILDKFGFFWKSPKVGNPWNDSYQRLVEYWEREGHSKVPQLYKDEDGYSLGTWVSIQRKNHTAWSNGQTTGMDPDKIGKLEALGFVWKLRYGRPKKGDKKFRNKRLGIGYDSDNDFDKPDSAEADTEAEKNQSRRTDQEQNDSTENENGSSKIPESEEEVSLLV